MGDAMRSPTAGRELVRLGRRGGRSPMLPASVRGRLGEAQARRRPATPGAAVPERPRRARSRSRRRDRGISHLAACHRRGPRARRRLPAEHDPVQVVGRLPLHLPGSDHVRRPACRPGRSRPVSFGVSASTSAASDLGDRNDRDTLVPIGSPNTLLAEIASRAPTQARRPSSHSPSSRRLPISQNCPWMTLPMPKAARTCFGVATTSNEAPCVS